MWDVIIWSDEDAIDYVPSSWGNEDKTEYKYPLSSENKIRKLIYDCENLTEKFVWYKAVLKRSNIKSLKKAKELCEQGKFTSNLDTSDAEKTDSTLNRGKRKARKYLEQTTFKRRKSNNDTQDNYEDDTDICSDGSTSSESSTKQNSAETLTRRLFKIPSTPLQKTSPNVIFNKTCNTSERAPTNSPLISETCKNILVSEKAATDTTEEVLTGENNATTRNSFASSNSAASTLTNYSGPNFPENYVLQLLRNQASISFELKCINKKIEKLEYLLLRKQGGDNNHQILEESSILNKLPCDSEKDLEDLDNQAADNLNITELINILHLSGGENIHKSIYGMMKKLMSNQLALKFSGQGKKRKIPFCKLININKALTYAVRKRHASASDDEIKKQISLYLAQTKARISNSKQTNVDN